MQPIEFHTYPAQLAQHMEDTLAYAMAEERSLEDLVFFLNDISPLEIAPEMLKGRIGVIGQGTVFPERTLLCTLTSRFKTLSPDISFLSCFDYELLAHPQVKLNRKIIRNPAVGELFSLPYGTVASYGYAARVVLDGLAFDFTPFPNGFFDTLMAFRIPGLSSQFQEGLLKTIGRVLKPKGYFIGSGGGRADGTMTTPELLAEASLMPIQSASLSPVTFIGSFSKHVGIILQKE